MNERPVPRRAYPAPHLSIGCLVKVAYQGISIQLGEPEQRAALFDPMHRKSWSRLSEQIFEDPQTDITRSFLSEAAIA